jgi:hypothetical protein
LLFVNILAVSFFIVAFVAMIIFIVRNEKRPAPSLVVFYRERQCAIKFSHLSAVPTDGIH